MHSRIFEIKTERINPDDWACDYDIADYDNHIDGVDYWGELNESDRVEAINRFFSYFPDNAFKIIENEPGKTAVVKFVGNTHDLYAKWREQIKGAANELGEEMTSTMLFRVRLALEEPLDICSKFYLNEWTGCTTSADDFFGFLRYLDEQNGGKPFQLYVGQVFDFHF